MKKVIALAIFATILIQSYGQSVVNKIIKTKDSVIVLVPELSGKTKSIVATDCLIPMQTNRPEHIKNFDSNNFPKQRYSLMSSIRIITTWRTFYRIDLFKDKIESKYILVAINDQNNKEFNREEIDSMQADMIHALITIATQKARNSHYNDDIYDEEGFEEIITIDGVDHYFYAYNYLGYKSYAGRMGYYYPNTKLSRLASVTDRIKKIALGESSYDMSFVINIRSLINEFNNEKIVNIMKR